MLTWRKFVAGAALALALMPPAIFARRRFHGADPQPRDPVVAFVEDPSRFDPSENFPKISAEKSGTIPTKDGRCLRLNLELGNVQVFTDESARISYHAIVEADSRDPGAEDFLRQFTLDARQTPWGIAIDGKVPWQGLHGRFGVSIEIHIPRKYGLQVSTGGGNIEVQDTDGRVSLASAGGNITVGRVGGADFSAESPHYPAGHIAARIETQGGHITVGDVAGTLRATTSGGHIIAGNIGGDAVLRTGGGQILAGRIAGTLTLDTGGGNITARLQDGSGQETSDAKSDVKNDAKSAYKPHEASQILSSEGDIVVYIPRKRAATIDAVIEQGSGHRIVADPSLSFKTSCQDSGAGVRTIHCEGELNGGGEILHLKAVSGNIALRLGDPRVESSAAFPTNWMQGGSGPSVLEPLNSEDGEDFNDADGFFAEIRRRILESWWGGIPVDAAEMQKHLERSVAPVYPEVARKAGIEGDVVLRVCVSSSGRVTDLKVMDGPPILARAAVEAVQHWQYQALRMNGRPANVVTTLIVSFRLR